MMGSEERAFSTQVTIEEDTPSPTTTTYNHHNHRRCCFNFPCFGSSPATSYLTSAASTTADSSERWWSTPIRAFKKIREWSEIVAGPKWKTFIRRFNRRQRHQVGGGGKFGYDPLSYALNFDEGPTQIEEEYDDHFPDFSSRFASIPASAKTSMDLGRGAPAG